MSPTRLRSLKHEYELFVEREIEDYKDSVPRPVLLSIGDEAVAALRLDPQMTLTEMVLWEEVDRIIARRLRLPSYSTWRRRRLKMLAEYRRPEHWGLPANCALARELRAAGEGHVLVAGVEEAGPAILSAAHGSPVTAIGTVRDAVERVMAAAELAGLARLVRGCVGDLDQWAPDVELRVVLCTPAAFAGLDDEARSHAITVLQSATADGGVHLLQTLVAGQTSPSVEELRSSYSGWAITENPDAGAPGMFLARKPAFH
jgi:hypothetical protein